jgi:hypothetical protein
VLAKAAGTALRLLATLVTADQEGAPATVSFEQGG